MNILIGLLIAVMVGAIVFLSLHGGTKDNRKEYLRKLKDFLEGDMETLEDDEDSFRIKFYYKNLEFIYEDVRQQGFQGRVFCQGFLRVKTGSDLVLSFTEREGAAIMDSGDSLQDIHSPWKQNVGKVALPQALSLFKVFTNDVDLVHKMLENEDLERIFVKFVNVDPRGHPVMPLEVLGGVAVLSFYSSGGFKPSLYDLVENYTAIEPFLEMMSMLAVKIKKIKQDLDLLK